MPRRGKDFTRGQKAAITRQYNKLNESIQDLKKDRNTFIRYPNKSNHLKDIDGIRTNKGIFYKYPGAELKKVKNKYILKLNYKKLREVFVPFPNEIVFDIERIRIFSDTIIEILKPDYVMWSVTGFRGKTRYDPDMFEYYLSETDHGLEDVLDAFAKTDTPYFNGIILGLYPYKKKYFRDIDVSNSISKAKEVINLWANN